MFIINSKIFLYKPLLNENIYIVGFIISIFVIKLLVNFIGMVDFGECAFSKMGWVPHRPDMH